VKAAQNYGTKELGSGGHGAYPQDYGNQPTFHGMVAARSGSEDVVDFERLVDLDKPFGPVRRPPPTALVERQF
jgi:hypothetical protein